MQCSGILLVIVEDDAQWLGEHLGNKFIYKKQNPSRVNTHVHAYLSQCRLTSDMFRRVLLAEGEKKLIHEREQWEIKPSIYVPERDKCSAAFFLSSHKLLFLRTNCRCTAFATCRGPSLHTTLRGIFCSHIP